MANYYLKNADASRTYRIEYQTTTMPGIEPPVTYYSARRAFICDTNEGATTPEGMPITEPDQEVTMNQLVVDLVLSELVPATLAEYRAAAGLMIGASWD